MSKLVEELLSFDYSQIPANRVPAKGYCWACAACGKLAADLYGIIGPHSYGYDESCALNAIQVNMNEDKIG
jgi:hypothetical protein